MLARAKYINIRGHLISFDEPKVMGILNVTPDSFYSGSRFRSEKEIKAAAQKMVL
jgi:dihydropteroate synthase